MEKTLKKQNFFYNLDVFFYVFFLVLFAFFSLFGFFDSIENSFCDKFSHFTDILYVYWPVSYSISAFIFGVVLFATKKCGISSQILVDSVLSVLILVLPVLLLRFFSIYIEFFSSFLFLFCSSFACVVVRICVLNQKRTEISAVFDSYVSADFVEKIIKNPDLVSSDGKKVVASVLFCTIRNFSYLYDRIDNPSLLKNILTEYFSAMNVKIFEQNGCIDKISNGKIASVFGYPVAFREHAYFSCVTAINMKKAEDEFNKKHMILGDMPFEIHSMVQINTGTLIAGDFGSSFKRNFTVLGNEVEFAGRLRILNELYDECIVCTEETWNSIDFGAHKDEIIAKKLGKVIFDGKERPVQVYSIIGLKSELTRQQIYEISVFEEALDLFYAHDFEKASEKFIYANELIPGDKAALIFAERCKKNLSKNIDESFDFVLNLSEKNAI